MKVALLFPGQGSQRVGMGRDLSAEFAVARQTFEEADSALGYALSKICFEGPEDALTLTANTQPAILTTSIAVYRALGEPAFVVAAGHSLGEWTALVAAGAIAFSDAVRLVHLRGKFMQEAVPPGEGAMAALLGLDAVQVENVCRDAAQGQVVSPANLNGAGQIVVAGHAAAVERACALAKERGAKRAVPLSVSAPFHCALMAPAAEKLRDALETVKVSAPRAKVVSNVLAEPYPGEGRIKELLVRQVTSPVRWEESVKWIAAQGVTRALELGSGSVLTGLVKRIAPTIQVTPIGEPHEVKAHGHS